MEKGGSSIGLFEEAAQQIEKGLWPREVAESKQPMVAVLCNFTPLELIHAAGPHADSPIFWANANQRVVRHGQWKLLLNPNLDPDEPPADKIFLADLEKDPGERTNLADKNPDLVKELTVLIGTWEKSIEPKKQ